MWDVILQAGFAATVVDFMNGLSLLLAGLIGLIWLSAGIIVWVAVQHYWSGKIELLPFATPQNRRESVQRESTLRPSEQEAHSGIGVD